MDGVWSAGAKRAAEAMLSMAGRAVVVRVKQQNASGGDVPRQEVVLRPCVMRVEGTTAEVLVSARAVEASGGAAELLSVASRVVADEVVWRVVACSAMECGGVPVCWRVQLAR